MDSLLQARIHRTFVNGMNVTDEYSRDTNTKSTADSWLDARPGDPLTYLLYKPTTYLLFCMTMDVTILNCKQICSACLLPLLPLCVAMVISYAFVVCCGVGA